MSAQEARLPAHPLALPVLCRRLHGQALFAGLKIKASWPGPCWQSRGGGGPAPGLKGIWLEKEASPSFTTSIAGGGVPREFASSSASVTRRRQRVPGTVCPVFTSATQGCPLHLPEVSNNLGPLGRPKSPPSTLSPPPADNTDNNSCVPTALVGKALLLPLSKREKRGSERFSHLPKATQLACGGARAQTQV